MEIAFLWFVCALIATAIGSRKGEAGSGFLVGLLFGPLGILFALLSSGDRMPCPHCKERIHEKAEICPHCRTPLARKA